MKGTQFACLWSKMVANNAPIDMGPAGSETQYPTGSADRF